MVASISFLEAPLKFQAPGVTLAIGLGIGKLVFEVLNKIENVFLVLMLTSVFFNKRRVINICVLVSVLTILLSLETFVLLPELTARANEIIANRVVSKSYFHLYYVGIEVVKLILLFILGLKLSNQRMLKTRTD